MFAFNKKENTKLTALQRRIQLSWSVASTTVDLTPRKEDMEITLQNLYALMGDSARIYLLIHSEMQI
jgi:hypothetical protein